MWDEITYPFINFNGATIDVKEWISNLSLHCACDYLSMLGLKLNHVSKRGHRWLTSQKSLNSKCQTLIVTKFYAFAMKLCSMLCAKIWINHCVAIETRWKQHVKLNCNDKIIGRMNPRNMMPWSFNMMHHSAVQGPVMAVFCLLSLA